MNLFINFISALTLFFLVSPGILVSIPQKGSKFEKALVHALVFAVIFVILRIVVTKLIGPGYVEGLVDKDILIKEATSNENINKGISSIDSDTAIKAINDILINDPSLFTDLNLSVEKVEKLMSKPENQLKKQIENAMSQITPSTTKKYIENNSNVFADSAHANIENKLSEYVK